MKTWVQTTLAALILATALPTHGAPWPQWRGPDRSGITSEPSGTWPPVKLWELTLGGSDSSPIIVNGRVYVTELVGSRSGVRCLNAETGALIWSGTSAGGQYGRHSYGDKPTYSGPLATPACDGTRLFTLSVDGDLQCWDAATGATNWTFNLYDAYAMGQRPIVGSSALRDYGYTSSPMLRGTNVVVEVGGSGGLIMFFSKATGIASGSWGSDYAGHTSGPAGPIGRVHLSLHYLWINGTRIPWASTLGCNIATPAVSGDYVVCTSGYSVQRTKCYLDAVEQWSVTTHEVTHSPVIHESFGSVYLAGVGKCLDLADGSLKWNFGSCTSVIVTGDDKLIAFDSTIRLYDATGTLLSQLPDVPTRLWSSGAFGEGKLIFKGRSNVACYSVEFSDTNAPALLAVTAHGGPDTVTVAFDELLEVSSAEDIANYRIEPGVSIAAATLGADSSSVVLQTSPLLEGMPYTLTLNNVRDRAPTPNTVDPDTQLAFTHQPLDDALVLCLRLDESSGTTARDSSTNGFNGAVSGASWSPGNGVLGGAADFDGVDDRIAISTPDVSGSGMTIALWARPDDFGVADARFISKATGTAEQDHNWMLSTINGTALRFRLKTGGLTTTLMTGTGELTAGQWTHVAATYDGTHMRIYRNGEPRTQVEKTGPIDTNAAAQAAVGNQPAGAGDRAFDGLLDDVQVYRRALDTNELATVMHWGHTTYWDRDRDGMNDAWERLHFGGTNALNGGAIEDHDGDGLFNLYESLAGTNPTNRQSVLALVGRAISAGAATDELVLTWPSTAGRTYSIQCASNLFSTFGAIETGIVADPPLNCRTVDVQSAGAFYRILLER